MADFDPVSYMMGQKSAGGGGGGGGGGGSSTLAGLTDVDLTNPTDGQTLVYDAASSKWANGSGGGGGGNMFVTLGTISAATVPMTYDAEGEYWYGSIDTDILSPDDHMYAVRNLTVTIGGTPYSVEPFSPRSSIVISENEIVDLILLNENSIILSVEYYRSIAEPVITNLTAEVYAPVPELAVLIGSSK